MQEITVSRPLIGVFVSKFGNNSSKKEFEAIEKYRGHSYCDAVRIAGEQNKPLKVDAESITVCQWSPIALSLKPPMNFFEMSIAPTFPFQVGYLIIAPLSFYISHKINPSVVLVRAIPKEHQKIINTIGMKYYHFSNSFQSTLNISALGYYTRRIPPMKKTLLGILNSVMGAAQRFEIIQKLSYKLFKSTFVTQNLNFILNQMFSNMSVCRNSTVVPYITGKVNISYFCIGGMFWGHNQQSDQISGFPYPIFTKVNENFNFVIKGR